MKTLKNGIREREMEKELRINKRKYLFASYLWFLVLIIMYTYT